MTRAYPSGSVVFNSTTAIPIARIDSDSGSDHVFGGEMRDEV